MSRKEFEITELDDKVVKLAIRMPGYEDIEEADKVYASKVAVLVREGAGRRKLLLRSELEDYLRVTGIWTEEDEKKVRALNEEVDTLLNQVRKGGVKLTDGRSLCIKAMDKRKEIVRVMNKRQVFDDATIEAMAESDRNDYLVYICTVYADSGKNYWESFEDCKNDKLSQAYQKGSVAAVEMIYNVDPRFEHNLPENKWLKKYKFIDEELNYTDRKTGEKVDKNGTPVKTLQEDVIKKFNNLQGDIVEEVPFIDDETDKPVALTS